MTSGCAALVPHTLLMPTVYAKGETEVDASVGIHGTSVQAAYAPRQGTVLLASGHRWGRGERWSLSGEAGGGYQWLRPNGSSWGLYGGFGYGAGYAYDDFCGDRCSTLSTADHVRYTYAFIQPTFLPLHTENGSLGLAVRLQPLRLSQWQMTKDWITADSVGIQRETQNRAGKWVVLLQPGISTRRRLSHRFWLTSGLSAFIPLQQRRNAPTIFSLAASIGVQLKLGR